MLKVSIIIPVCNAERFLRRCLTSVLNQTLQEFEVIIINDGSTDSSESIIRSFSDNRINLISGENQGPSFARNRGLEAARGEMITFIDADDYIEPGYLKQMYDAMQENKCDFVCCGYRFMLPDGKVIGVFPDPNDFLKFDENRFLTKEEVFAGVLLHKSVAASLWNKMFRADLLKGMYFDTKTTIGEDLLFVLEYLSKSDKFFLVKEQLYNYYINPNGIMKGINKKNKFDLKWLSEWKAVMKAEDYCANKGTMVENAVIYKKTIVANKILSKAMKCKYWGNECEDMKMFIKNNRLAMIRNPFLNLRVKVKSMLYR